MLKKHPAWIIGRSERWSWINIRDRAGIEEDRKEKQVENDSSQEDQDQSKQEKAK